jgi:hypothetical protein
LDLGGLTDAGESEKKLKQQEEDKEGLAEMVVGLGLVVMMVLIM